MATESCQLLNEILVNFSCSVAEKLQNRDHGLWGLLLGSYKEDSYDVIGSIRCTEHSELHELLKKSAGPTSNLSLAVIDRILNKLLVHIPAGIEIIGIFYYQEEFKCELCSFVRQTLMPALNRDFNSKSWPENLLLCRIVSKENLEVEIVNKDLESWAAHKNINIKSQFDDNVFKQWRHQRKLIRLRAAVPCQISLCGTPFIIHQDCQRVLSKLRDSPVAFIAKDSNLVISSDSGEMFDLSVMSNKSQKVTDFRLVRKMCASSNKDELFCPILMFNASSTEVLDLNLDLETIVYAENSWTADEFITAGLDSLYIQAKYMLSNVVEVNNKFKHCMEKAYHYLPSDNGHMVTMIYPQANIGGKVIDEDDLMETRRDVHEMLSLPVTKPVLLKTQNYFNEHPGGYLINPHEKLKSGIESGMSRIVDGNYAYHHYMQDRIDDNGWGCAYRSLQTICSWFQLQGYTKKTAPSHVEIQEALVAVGDKPKKFIGSKQWIGSFEVSICLDKILNVSAKILHVSSGSEMANKGRELLEHFEEQGTPVMIGGGVLAHTILGVHFDQLSGEIRFLILDPHYTGSENLKTVQEKGWCGWKGPKFWDQTAHYNMCMPQRPSKI